jgi:hypothetical protein
VRCVFFGIRLLFLIFDISATDSVHECIIATLLGRCKDAVGVFVIAFGFSRVGTHGEIAWDTHSKVVPARHHRTWPSDLEILTLVVVISWHGQCSRFNTPWAVMPRLSEVNFPFAGCSGGLGALIRLRLLEFHYICELLHFMYSG